MNKLSYILFCFYFISCSSTEKLIDYSNAPQWVQEHPLSEDYYIGIGVSKKKKVDDFRTQAKKEAFNEISSGISVSVSSNSVLKQQENNGKFKEMFDSSTETYTNNELAGCKQVGRWENRYEYWVYYKLSKAKVEEDKRNAIEDATISLRQALSYDNQNDLPRAISNYALALSAVKPYLGERLKTEFNGETIFLGQYILDHYRDLINSLRMEYDSTDQLLYKSFKSIKPLKIELKRGNDLVGNVPIKVESTGLKYLGSFKFNENGMLELPEVSANTYRSKELVVLKMDLLGMVEDLVVDDLVKEVLKGYKPTSLDLLYRENNFNQKNEESQPTVNNNSNNNNNSEPVKEKKPIKNTVSILANIKTGVIKNIEVIKDVKESIEEVNDVFDNLDFKDEDYSTPSPNGSNLTPSSGELLDVVKNENFDNNKLSVSKHFLSQNKKTYSTAYIKEVAQNFNFETNKLEFAKYAYNYTSDKGNYYQINSIFDFSSSKSKLNEFIKKQK